MRYLMSLGAGAVMGLLLFLLMSTLISGGEGYNADEGGGKVVEFIRIRQDDITNIKQRQKPKEPEKPKKPPPPPKLKVSKQNKPPPTPLRMETPNVDISLGAGGGPYLGAWNPGDINSDGDVIPIVRINPQYPRDALMAGSEIEAGGGKTPGMILPAIIGIATGEYVRSAIIGGGLALYKELGPEKITGAANRTADTIAKELRNIFRRQGWI